MSMEGVYTLLLLGEHYKRNYNLPILFELSLIWVLYLFFSGFFLDLLKAKMLPKAKSKKLHIVRLGFFMDYVNCLVFGKSKS